MSPTSERRQKNCGKRFGIFLKQEMLANNLPTWMPMWNSASCNYRLNSLRLHLVVKRASDEIREGTKLK